MSYKKVMGTLVFTGVTAGAFMLMGGGEADAASHKVERGDTLWGLSREYHTSVSNLKSLNGLHSDLIHVGQTLEVPGSTPAKTTTTKTTTQPKATTTTSSSVYTVKSGDTFYGIAKKHSVSFSAIKSVNTQITNFNRIYVGQKVNIPSGGKVSGQVVHKTYSGGAEVSSDKAQSILNTGMKYLGTPYHYGAARGSTSSFDCSSFVWYVYKQHGVNLGTYSRAQYQSGQSVSKSQLQKGDLVFFSSPDRVNRSGIERIGHVGIYMGNGKMLNANDNGVSISDINSSYWSRMYVGAKRVL